MATYKQWVRSKYEWSKSKYVMPIDMYVETVIKNMPSVQKDEIYEPIRVAVQLGRDPSQCVPLHVDYADNWYERLQNAVLSMTKKGTSVAGAIDLVDITGKTIRGLDAKALSRVGKVKAKINKQIYQLSEQQALPEPPKDMRTDKLHQLKVWHETSGLRESIVGLVANELKDKTSMHAIRSALCVGSSLETKIGKAIKQSLPDQNIQAFLKTYGCNERARTGTPPDNVISKMTQSILKHTINGLNAADARIGRHIAHMAVGAIKEDANIGKLFPSYFAISDSVPAENGLDLYKSIMRKQIGKPDNVIEFIQNVYRASPIACRSCKTNDEDEEPYYDNYFYGDEEQIYSKYQTLSNNAVFMEIGDAGSAVADTNKGGSDLLHNEDVSSSKKLRAARLRKKLYQEQQLESKMDKSKFEKPPSKIERGPKIVPIAAANNDPYNGMPNLISRSTTTKQVTNPGMRKIANPMRGKFAPFDKLDPIQSKNVVQSKNAIQSKNVVQSKNANQSVLPPGFVRIKDGYPDISDYTPNI